MEGETPLVAAVDGSWPCGTRKMRGLTPDSCDRAATPTTRGRAGGLDRTSGRGLRSMLTGTERGREEDRAAEDGNRKSEPFCMAYRFTGTLEDCSVIFT